MFWLRYGLIVPLAVAQAWLGPSEYAAALVPLTYSLASLVLVYALGVLYGGPALGLVASALLAIVPLDVIAATDLHADLPASFWMAAAVYAVKRGEADGEWSRFWYLGGGVALGLAYLTKESALAVAVVLLLRLLWCTRGWHGYGWLMMAFLLIVGLDMAWLWKVAGNPLYRYSDVVTHFHVDHMMRSPPSYEWMLGYPDMLLNPLSGYFGYFAGIAYLVLAGTLWSMRMRHPAAQELFLWWCPLLVLFNFAPLDASFSRPLFVHFARTLHPVLIPFVLTASVWMLHGLSDRPGLRAGIIASVATLAAIGLWTAHFDYRSWAAVARQAVPVIQRYPDDTVIATDHTTMWLLRSLLSDRRDRIASYSEADFTNTQRPVLFLLDPLFLAGDIKHGYMVPSMALSPPPDWKKVAEFTRPRRPRLRESLLASMGLSQDRRHALAFEPAVLWLVVHAQGAER
jgi:4-amino-4-deoxy-L-arabinose transferase-like glycosyltransferase